VPAETRTGTFIKPPTNSLYAVTHASTETTKILHKEASVAVAIAANGAAILETRPTKNSNSNSGYF